MTVMRKIQPDKQTPQGTHGNATNYAASAERALKTKRPLPPATAPVYQAVLERYAEVGATGMLVDRAAQHETVTTLYFELAMRRVELEQLEQLNTVVLTYNRLSGGAMRNWDLVRQFTEADNVVDYEDMERRRQENVTVLEQKTAKDGTK